MYFWKKIKIRNW